MIAVRPSRPADRQGILRVVESLPEWFDEDARLRAIPVDIGHNDVLVATSEGIVVGFIALHVGDGRLHVGWLGVRRDCQRRGIGSRLIRAAERMGRRMGLAELATVTLGDGVDYAPYEATRAFYRKQGFVVIQRNKTDNPGCPEEIKLSKRIGRLASQGRTDTARGRRVGR